MVFSFVPWLWARTLLGELVGISLNNAVGAHETNPPGVSRDFWLLALIGFALWLPALVTTVVCLCKSLPGAARLLNIWTLIAAFLGLPLLLAGSMILAVATSAAS